MSLPLYQVDAFTGAVFAGNPAAVCPLDDWLPDAMLQSIAAENNLSETAYFVPDGDGYALRWFTPAAEVDLCGHATLASGFVIMTLLQPGRDSVAFHTRVSGTLTVARDGDRFVMDLPQWPADPATVSPDLGAALGRAPALLFTGPDWMAVFDHEGDVAALDPDMAALARIEARGVIATATGRDVDFVSRFFAPRFGIPEDPVTGSAHCMLAPYWAERLGKTDLLARQISRRGGEVHCTVADGRVRLAGRAVLYMEGRIHV
ncbi:MAG: PhzF family phenazine biosynthesis protein [Alphaproteobacteria bacterium]